MVFLQTAEMLELYKRNTDSGVLLHTGEGKTQFKSKYNMIYILMNGVDQACGNILTFAIGLYSPGLEDKAYKWFFQKF